MPSFLMPNLFILYENTHFCSFEHDFYLKYTYVLCHMHQRFGEVQWPSGRVSDSGARGQQFDPHSGRHVVSLSKIHLPPKKYW